MRKQHAINSKVLVGGTGFNPPLLAVESNSDQMQIKKQHAINSKVLVGGMGFNPPLLAIESNSDQMQIKAHTEAPKRKCCLRRSAAPDFRSKNSCSLAPSS
jgi:hypothetical protein